jgi:hypothetical protein
MRRFARPVVLLGGLATAAGAVEDPWLVVEGGKGPGAGRHVVLLAGDEEYRSEEALPMLARILAVHHGFQCTVLFSIDPATGAIDPDNQTNVPGLAALDAADMVVMFWRFRELPDADMKHVVDYVESGKPLLAIRTSTHAFDYRRHSDSPYAKWTWNGSTWPGGFGQQILGDTWVAHHGEHGSQSTRGVIETSNADHPILRGVNDVWGPTDVYAIDKLLPTDRVLLRGQVLAGMKPDSKPVEGAQNSPMMPLLWTRERPLPKGPDGWPKTQRIVTSTIGASVDLQSEDLRRAFVNSCYWALRMEDKIPEKSDVSCVGKYEPTFFGFGKGKKGVKPSELARGQEAVPSTSKN